MCRFPGGRGLNMSGNASYRLANTAVLSVCAVEAPIVVTSQAFDARLAETYLRVGMRSGMLEELAGVRERRWWPEDVTFADAAAMAGAKALAEAGITPAQIGVMINTSVSRAYLEPSTAVAVHHQLGLPTSCLNFDLANACLGFVNGIQLAGTMIDSGQADYALLVDARRVPVHPGDHARPARRTGRDGRRPAVAVRHPDAGLRSRGNGAGPGRPASRGPPGRRRGQPSRNRAPRPVRRRPEPDAHRLEETVPGRAGAGPGHLGRAAGAAASTGPTSTTSSPTRPRSCTSGPWPRRSAYPSPGSRSPCRATATSARPRFRSPWPRGRSAERGDAGAAARHRIGPEHLLRRDHLVSRRVRSRRSGPDSTQPGRAG